MQDVCKKLRSRNQVVVNRMDQGIYFVVDKHPNYFRVSGYIDDKPINQRLINELDLMEFVEGL
jgi:hypothetical protein